MSNESWIDDEIMKEKAVIRTRHLTQHPLSRPSSAAELLDQRKVWVNAQLEEVRIKDMDEQYLFATMTWLIKRSEELKFAIELYYASIPGPSGDGATQEFDAGFAQFMREDAQDWIKATPLFQKLRKRYNKLTGVSKKTEIHLPVLLDAQG